MTVLTASVYSSNYETSRVRCLEVSSAMSFSSLLFSTRRLRSWGMNDTESRSRITREPRQQPVA